MVMGPSMNCFEAGLVASPLIMHYMPSCFVRSRLYLLVKRGVRAPDTQNMILLLKVL